MLIVIPVSVMFEGMVEVQLLATTPTERRRILAEKIALAKILATTVNPDAPEDDACLDYAAEFDLSEDEASKDWDATTVAAVGGQWTLAPTATVAE